MLTNVVNVTAGGSILTYNYTGTNPNDQTLFAQYVLVSSITPLLSAIFGFICWLLLIGVRVQGWKVMTDPER